MKPGDKVVSAYADGQYTIETVIIPPLERISSGILYTALVDALKKSELCLEQRSARRR